MKLHSKFLVALLTLVSLNSLIMADDEGESLRRKVKRFCSIAVSGNACIGGNLSVGGNVTVGGSVTASSFVLSPAGTPGAPGLPGVGGALAWGEVEKTTAQVFAGLAVVSMDAAGATNVGVTPVTGAAGGLTLTNPGIYLFHYYITDVAGLLATIDLFNLTTAATVPNSTVGNGVLGTGQTHGFVLSVITVPSTTIQLRVTSGLVSIPAVGVGAKLTAIRIA